MPQFLQETFGRFAPALPPLFRVAWIVIFGIILLRFMDSGLKRLKLLIPPSEAQGTRAEQRAETLRVIIRSVVKVVLIVVVGLSVSRELGFDIMPVIASVSVVGVAIGFGAQSVVKDLLSGFFILLEDQYGVGDVVRIGTLSGVVERMTLRATVLRNLQGQVHVIPNGSIQTVTVLSKEWARAVIDVTVGHEEDIEKVTRVLDQVGNGLERDFPESFLEHPKILGVEALNQDGITIRCLAKTPPLRQWDVMREWRRRIKEEFGRRGIALPYTQRTVWLKGEHSGIQKSELNIRSQETGTRSQESKWAGEPRTMESAEGWEPGAATIDDSDYESSPPGS
jgi:small-conductance mechanosensitive channel